MLSGRVRWAVLGAVAGVLTVGAIAFGSMAATGTKHSVAATPAPAGAAGAAVATGTPGAKSSAQRGQMLDTYLNDLAANLHIDRQTLDNALKTTANQEIDKAVQNNQLTQQQADQIKQRIASGQFPPLGGPGGFGRDGRFGGDMGALQGCMQNVQTAVTQALGGETPDQVRADLRSGKTFDQILAAHNTNAQALGNTVATAMQPCLDQAVKNNTLTAQKEQDILNSVKSGKIPFVGGERPGFGGHGRPGAAGTPKPGATQ